MPSRKDRFVNWTDDIIETLENWYRDWLGAVATVIAIIAIVGTIGGCTLTILPPGNEDWPRKHLILEEDCIRYEVENWSRTFTICGPLIMPDEESCYVVDKDGNIALYCPGAE